MEIRVGTVYSIVFAVIQILDIFGTGSRVQVLFLNLKLINPRNRTLEIRIKHFLMQNGVQ